MTKFVLNLVCIIGIAGAAHAGAVADLEIDAGGHAYLVFIDEDADTGTLSNMAGYSIDDTRTTGQLVFNASAAEYGTGQYGTGWVSLMTQQYLAGEAKPGTQWFSESIPSVTDFRGEGNIDGHMTRGNGVPVYIGKILASTAAGDFLAGGVIADNVEFKTIAAKPNPAYNPGEPEGPDNREFLSEVGVGAIKFRQPAALGQGETTLSTTGTRMYRETGAHATPGTMLDVDYVENLDGSAGDVIVIDVDVTSGAGPVTYGGHVIVNGNVMAVTYADDKGTSDLRVRAEAGATTVVIDTTLTETGTDGLGSFGTIGSSMKVSLVAGDVDLDGDSDDADIDAHFAARNAASTDLIYDLNSDGAIAEADTDVLVNTLVATSVPGNGTSYGDANLDGASDLGDYTIWAGTYLGTGVGGWANGNFNGDAGVDLGDYTIWAASYLAGGAPQPAATPEPATMALLAFGGLALVKRRRRR